MQNIPSRLVFRSFSANDWNQPEQIILSSQIPLVVSNLPILFSNAEKLRKIDLFNDIKCVKEPSRIIKSNGLRILFPFILYFTLDFIKSPLEHKVEGEIALLLRIMVYASRNHTEKISITTLLKLTTQHVFQNRIEIEGHIIELSEGLYSMIMEYIGEKPADRHQKLFPNLNLDKLADYFRRAFKKILPQDVIPALPEAFRLFPHCQKNQRISQLERFQQIENPDKVLHDFISWRKIKQQLLAKSVSQPA